MATFTPLLRPDKVRPDGRAPLYLAVRDAGLKRMVALGVYVRPKDWNKKAHQVRKTEPEWTRLNDFISQAVSAGHAALAQRKAALEPVTADTLADDVRAWLDPSDAEGGEGSAGSGDVLTFMEPWVESFSERGQPSTFKAYRTAYRRLRDYSRGELAWERLTPAFLRRWGSSLGAEPPHGEGLKQNYVRKLLTSVRTACRAAIRDGAAPAGWRDLFEQLDGDPLLRTERAEKGRLTMEEVERFAAAAAEPGSLVEAVRDSFTFAFYAGGMRFGDLCLLQWSDIERDGEGKPARLSYDAEKTGKPTRVPITPPAATIITRYEHRREGDSLWVFPYLDGRDVSTPAKRRAALGQRNAYANKVLKKLAKRAKIEKHLTTHMARHSLATHLLESGTPAYVIQRVLQHSSLQVTERYLRDLDESLMDDAFRDAFGSK